MVRAVHVLNLGWHTLGSFRIACRPKLLGGWPEGFRALESAVSEATEALMKIPHAQLSELRGESPRAMRPPRIGEREGWIDVHCIQDTEESVLVLTRAWFPFRWWPVGGWIVFAAFRRWPERAAPVPEAELDEMW